MDDLHKAAETTVPGLSPRIGRVLTAFRHINAEISRAMPAMFARDREHRMQILAWLFFRPPESAWRWHVVSVFIALTAVSLPALYYNLLAQVGPIQAEGAGLPQIALEQALVFNFCGKYGHLSPVVDSGRFLKRDKWPTDQTFSQVIVTKYGAVGRFCEEQFQRFLNNENSLSLSMSALLLLPPGDSASTLAVKLILFECAVLFLALYFLSLFGVLRPTRLFLLMTDPLTGLC